MMKINKFEKKAAELEAWSDVLEHAIKQLQYCMIIKTDENGDEVIDEDGNTVRIPPSEDACRFDYLRYTGWKQVVETLETMKI